MRPTNTNGATRYRRSVSYSSVPAVTTPITPPKNATSAMDPPGSFQPTVRPWT